jgi:multidrug efflux pump subunit AcrA (membrane-fusion protein)
MRYVVIFGGLLLAACGRGEEAQPLAQEAADSPPTPEVRWVPVRSPGDTSVLEAPAVVRAAPDANGEVSVSVSARVERVHVQVGTRVERGAVVAEVLAPQVLAAAATYVGASKRLAFHKARAEELEALREEGLVDKARVFEQRMQAIELDAAREEALATLRGAGVDPAQAEALTRRGSIALRAPVAGVVTELDARPGEMREPGSGPLARIRGAGPARVEVRTPSPWMGGASVTLELSGGERIALRPEPIASAVEPEAGTHVHWLVPTETRALTDGLRGVVRIGARPGTWQVPAGAVLSGPGKPALWRRRAGAVERVEVDVVASSGANALVTGPLEANDEVAAEALRFRPTEPAP